MVRVWDASTGKELLTLKGHTDEVNGVSFSPDGGRLASASRDGTVRVWDASSGKELLTLKGHTGVVYGVSFSPDGQRLASASGDGTVRIWEASPVPDEVLRRRGLASHVASLFEELALREEVLAALDKDSNLSEADREFTLQVARTHSEDYTQLRNAAWKVVKTRDASKDTYVLALRRAEDALHQSQAFIASDYSTLGIAQYRVGHYAVALTTLTKSEELNATKKVSRRKSLDYLPPVNLAFLAMTRHRLGQGNEAKATLARLREIMKQPNWAKNDEIVGFLREAEGLIEGKSHGKGQ
jgi:hypothetical protein